MRDPSCRRQTASTSRSRDRLFEPGAVLLFEISCPEAAFLVMLDNKKAATHNGVMPTTQIRSSFGPKVRSARRAQHQIGCNARRLHVNDPDLDHNLDQGIVSLVVLNIKLDVMHGDFMSTTQICPSFGPRDRIARRAQHQIGRNAR